MHIRITTVVCALLLAGGSPARAERVSGSDSGSIVRALSPAEREGASQRRERHQGVEQTERISRVIEAGDGTDLDVGNITGDIHVVAAGGNEIRVEATKRAYGQTDALAREELARLDVEIDERGRRIEVRTGYRSGDRRTRARVDYEISVPAKTRLHLHSVAGDIVVTGVKGDIRAETVRGDASVSGTGRMVTVKTVSGNVEIGATDPNADVTGSTVSGSLRASGIRASRLELTTVSGDLVLENMAAARALFNSVSGDISYSGTIDPQGRYDIKSHSGDVRLQLPADTGFTLEASSFSGDIESTLPLTIQSSSGAGAGAGRGGHGRAVRAVHGEGSAILEVSTFSGDVTITGR